MVSPSRRDDHQFEDSDTDVLSTNICTRRATLSRDKVLL